MATSHRFAGFAVSGFALGALLVGACDRHDAQAVEMEARKTTAKVGAELRQAKRDVADELDELSHRAR